MSQNLKPNFPKKKSPLQRFVCNILHTMHPLHKFEQGAYNYVLKLFIKLLLNFKIILSENTFIDPDKSPTQMCIVPCKREYLFV